jgi:hypothetical protein
MAAAASRRGNKRRAPEPPTAAAVAADADAGAAQQEEKVEQAQAATSPSQLTGIAKLFGCGRCPRSKAGCSACRAKVAAALVSPCGMHTPLAAQRLVTAATWPPKLCFCSLPWLLELLILCLQDAAGLQSLLSDIGNCAGSECCNSMKETYCPF